MAEQKLEASSAKPTTPGRKRGPTNSELRLRRLTKADDPDPETRGILEIFPDDEPAAEDAPLARAEDDEHDRQ
jgi:hypothetical protein